MRSHPSRLLIVLALFVPAGASAQNILFYGNSYTNAFNVATRSVPDLVQELATIGGQGRPITVDAASNGRDFAWHLSNNTGIIGSGLGAGDEWDYVVMQNQSIRPTLSHPFGNRTQHRANALSLYQTVATHSPSVRPVFFETWARAVGSPDLTGFAGGPTQMQQELRDGYNLAAADIDASVGSPISMVAPVGDAWEFAAYDNLHINDRSHANARGRLLTALVIYSTIYGDDTTDLFDSGAMDGTLASLSLSQTDGAFLTGVSDATVIPSPAGLLVVGGAGLLAARRRR